MIKEQWQIDIDNLFKDKEFIFLKKKYEILLSKRSAIHYQRRKISEYNKVLNKLSKKYNVDPVEALDNILFDLGL